MATTNNNQNEFNADAIASKDNDSPEQTDGFWTHSEIDVFRFNQAFPYQLILVKREGNQYTRDATANKWNFTLPIAPSTISFSMPFAIRAGTQLTGFYEQHGGAPVRYIQFSGTTGVLPLKGSAPARKTASFIQGIFGGTIATAQRTAQAAISLVSGPGAKPNVVSDNEFFYQGDTIAKTSGYYQFRKLQEFFENYAAFKKTEAAKDYILAFAIWKDQAVYLVTPTQFTVNRSADSPYEYPYTLAFKAWKRVNLQKSGPSANQFKPITRDSSKLGKAFQEISDARRVLEGAAATIAAVGGDIDHALLEPLREVSLWMKDALGIPLALADLPVQIIKDAQQAIITAIGVQYAAQGLPAAFNDASLQIQNLFIQLAQVAAQTDQATTQGGVSGSVNLSQDPTSTNYAQNVFQDPASNFELFNRINVASLSLPPVLIHAIINERDRIREKIRLDFEQQRNTLVQSMADFADFIGAGSTTYSNTYNRLPYTTTRTPSTNDFQVIFAMNRAILELNRLAATGEVNRFTTDSINYVAGLASQAGMAFKVPTSKFAVPFPYGMTIEQLATRYLNTPDRWIEIAALNGLRAPYVDEVGFDLPLLTNGNNNQVIVSDSSNLFIGQLVWLSSTTTSRTSRHIVYIEKLNSGQSILGLDGAADLNRYSTLANATLHAFLPDTVNSMMQIYIPSDSPPGDQDYKTKSIPGINYFDPLVEAAGVDILLTEQLDLPMTPDGDSPLAVGLANIVQEARIRLNTPQGTLARHPKFGLAIKPGVSTADVDAQTLLRSCQDLFADDNTFTGVTSASVLKQGPTTTIAIDVGIAGVSQNVPISFKLQ
jgi:hypothetical protein